MRRSVTCRTLIPVIEPLCLLWIQFLSSLCVQDFEALQGRADGKTAFYEALSRSLGGAKGSELLKEAAAWFYSLDHSVSPAGYNLFSRALNNATRSDTGLTSGTTGHSVLMVHVQYVLLKRF